MMQPDPLSATFAALADPTRRAILARLSLGEASVNDLVAPFRISQPAVSRHLKVLEHAGLITRGREAQYRPCRLDARRLKDIAAWVDHYRQFWEQSFDRLDDYLTKLKKTQAASSQKISKQKSIITKSGTSKSKEKKNGTHHRSNTTSRRSR
jgi:DNA-binding transcriptional ArsR family regulator